MTPALGGHPGFVALGLDNPKRGFALTLVRTLRVCVYWRVCVGAVRGLLLEEMGSAPSMEYACAVSQPQGERCVSTTVWPTGATVN